jgi:hypothetical protein
MTTPTDLVVPDDFATSDAETPSIPLTLQDRCDACRAQAFVRTSILSPEIDKMVDLLFCGHHFAKYETILRAKSLSVHDERDKINEKPTASSGTAADNK